MKKMHHIMFAFVSTVRAGAPSAPPIVYAGLAGGDDYAAIQTNESAIVYEERTLRARGEELERVYLIVTDAVKKPLTGTDKTHVGYLEGRLVRPEACPELAGRFQHIPYTDTQRDLSANMLEIASVARTVRTFMDEQRADTSCEHKFTVHADMTGGFRHASMMMTSILQILSFYDLQQGDVLYSDPDRRQGDPTYVSHPYVYKATSILNVTQLLSGTSEFVKFGSADGLKAYFQQEHATTFSGELKGLMAAMAAFSDAIRVCSTGRLIPTLDRLGAALRAFQACEKKNVTELIFDTITEIIQKDYGPLLAPGDRYLEIIDWCGKHHFYQQQATLATEWLPAFLVDLKIAYTDDPKVRAFCRADGAKKFRTWKQVFILDFNGLNDAKKTKSGTGKLAKPRMLFHRKFQMERRTKAQRDVLRRLAQENGWDEMRAFLEEYEAAAPRYEAYRAGACSLKEFFADYPALERIVRFTYDGQRQQNPACYGHVKFAQYVSQRTPYEKLLARLAVLNNASWEQLLPLPEEDDKATEKPAEPLTPEMQQALRDAYPYEDEPAEDASPEAASADEDVPPVNDEKKQAKKWQNRLETYFLVKQRGQLKTAFPFDEFLHLLTTYYVGIHMMRNNINHATALQEVDGSELSDRITAYTAELRAIRAAREETSNA